MSDRIPTFRHGDRVKVMQTREAESNGLANLHGTVVGGIIRGNGERVSFVLPDGERTETVHIPDRCLMKIWRHPH